MAQRKTTIRARADELEGRKARRRAAPGPSRKAPKATTPKAATSQAATPRAASPSITVRPLRPADWSLVERLFGPNGAVGGCWCMWWRRRGGRAWEAAKGEPNRRALKGLVETGDAHAVIALAGTEPVGWCNFGPRGDFPRLDRSRVLQRAGAEPRWSIACFFVRAGWRNRGIGGRLLAAATKEAFRLGAAEIEGYPKTYSATAKSPAAFIWTGVPSTFAKAGYAPDRAENSPRLIYVKRRGSRTRAA